MTNKEILKRQIIYRSNHRGTKEMDLLLGNFVKKYINNLNENDLKDLVDLLKKNIVMVPVVASVLVGTFTGVRYIVNLTDTINQNELRLTNLERDVGVLEKNITDINTRLSSAEATWQMAENLYRQLADQVREHSYDIKDLNREINY